MIAFTVTNEYMIHCYYRDEAGTELDFVCSRYSLRDALALRTKIYRRAEASNVQVLRVVIAAPISL